MHQGRLALDIERSRWHSLPWRMVASYFTYMFVSLFGVKSVCDARGIESATTRPTPTLASCTYFPVQNAWAPSNGCHLGTGNTDISLGDSDRRLGFSTSWPCSFGPCTRCPGRPSVCTRRARPAF